jgi:hypothetical protein
MPWPRLAAEAHTSRVLTPSADAFTALARSSPWRWSTLRFTVSWSGGPTGHRAGAVRAFLRRPELLRVVALDGTLIQVVRKAGPAVSVLGPGGGSPVQPTSAGAPEPVLRPDGLVDRRPDDSWTSFDAPMFQNYHWVAMLDPVELADGIDWDTDAVVPALVVGDVREVQHDNRPAWEAVVRTTPAYEPRCGCCPLLRSREVDLLEYRDYPDRLLAAYPEAHRVRLDVGTGVCVYSEEIGGLAPGQRHEVRIEAVDEPMADALFVEPPREPVRRQWGWSAFPGRQ